MEKFVGQVTHDVRNGLNALELQLTYLGEICTDPEAAEETKRLRASLNDLTRQLQALRASTAAPTVHAMDYPADEFFADLRERFERLHKLPVTWQIEVGSLSLAVDPELTMTAFLELLGNATHFASEEVIFATWVATAGSAVEVTLTERKSLNTPPIATENWTREPLRSGRRSAYGLGLFRAARILEAQGGSISVRYSGPEHQLITAVALPTAAAA